MFFNKMTLWLAFFLFSNYAAAQYNDELSQEILNRNVAAAKVLLEQNKIKKGVDYLHLAAQVNLPELFEPFIAKGFEVNILDRYKQSPLHRAAYAGSYESIIKLIQLGADLNLRNTHGDTALTVACFAHHQDDRVIKALGGNVELCVIL